MPKGIEDNICDNIQLLRKQKGMSQYELAIDLDIHYGYLNDIENGRRLPSMQLLHTIANYFNVGISDIAEKSLVSNASSTEIKNDISTLISSVNDKETLLVFLSLAESI